MISDEIEKHNPLDKDIGKAIRIMMSPETVLQRQRLAYTHRDFTVSASACITIDEFLQGLVPPLKATGRPLYYRYRLLTDFSMNVYDSSQSASGHLVDTALEHLSPGLVRQSLPGYQFGFGGEGFGKEDVAAEEKRV
ncbi:MAG: hypothetical protein ACFFCW_13560 [Candidatus Hodarchaeota archaeon]